MLKKKEVDFALIKNNHIEEIIEVEVSDQDISKSLDFFHQKYQLPAVQVVKELRHDRLVGKIKLMRAEHYLAELFL